MLITNNTTFLKMQENIFGLTVYVAHSYSLTCTDSTTYYGSVCVVEAGAIKIIIISNNHNKLYNMVIMHLENKQHQSDLQILEGIHNRCQSTLVSTVIQKLVGIAIIKNKLIDVHIFLHLHLLTCNILYGHAARVGQQSNYMKLSIIKGLAQELINKYCKFINLVNEQNKNIKYTKEKMIKLHS